MKIQAGTSTIGEIVAEDFRSARIFKDSGIDYCCGGDKSLREACREAGIGLDQVIQKLNELKTLTPLNDHNYKDWSPEFLSEYIKNRHHTYVRKSLPELVFYTGKIADVHGNAHPELMEVAALFNQLNHELLQHMNMEEQMLFPAIRNLSSGEDAGAPGIIEAEISRMRGEHEFAGKTMDRIRELTKDYRIPEDGCNTYQVTMQYLEQFEEDLHQHVHLENNILFKKSLARAADRQKYK